MDSELGDIINEMETVTDEAVDNSSEYTKKTRQELADLDDLDI